MPAFATRRDFLRLLVTGSASAALLAACGGAAATSSSGAAASSPPASAAASTKVSTSASVSPAASASTSAKPSAPSAAGASGAPLKFGFVEPLTGPQAIIGKDNNDGFSLYLASVNGTMAGRKIQPVFADDQLQADVALTKAQQLVENDKVTALMGFTFTPGTYAVATYVKDRAHIPLLVTGNATGKALTIDPKFASPYLMRFTETEGAYAAVAADWAYKNGHRKAILATYDTAAGIENSDLWARAFIYRGGQVVQEFHPPAGTSDYGPYLAQLDKNADILVEFAPGADGMRMLQQFSNYTAANRPLFFDLGAVATGGPNLGVLKDQAVGVVANKAWVESLDNAANQAFLKAFKAKYPDRPVSPDLAMGWASGQILQQALEKVQGKAEDTQAFLKALYSVDVQVPKGEVKIDPEYHDIVQSYYVYKIGKQGNNYELQVIDTYKGVSQFYDLPPDQMKRFPAGQLKGKWVGMTKDKLPTLLTS